jgi:hypothetical protein
VILYDTLGYLTAVSLLRLFAPIRAISLRIACRPKPQPLRGRRAAPRGCDADAVRYATNICFPARMIWIPSVRLGHTHSYTHAYIKPQLSTLGDTRRHSESPVWGSHQVVQGSINMRPSSAQSMISSLRDTGARIRARPIVAPLVGTSSSRGICLSPPFVRTAQSSKSYGETRRGIVVGRHARSIKNSLLLDADYLRRGKLLLEDICRLRCVIV